LAGILIVLAAGLLTKYVVQKGDLINYFSFWAYQNRGYIVPYPFFEVIFFQLWSFRLPEYFSQARNTFIFLALLWSFIAWYRAGDTQVRKYGIVVFAMALIPPSLIGILSVRSEARYLLPALPFIAILLSYLVVVVLPKLRLHLAKLTMMGCGLWLAFILVLNVWDILKVEPEPWQEVCQILERMPDANSVYVHPGYTTVALTLCAKGLDAVHALDSVTEVVTPNAAGMVTVVVKEQVRLDFVDQFLREKFGLIRHMTQPVGKTLIVVQYRKV
jgi:hypothetical protein